jgi:hypothetical protein
MSFTYTPTSSALLGLSDGQHLDNNATKEEKGYNIKYISLVLTILFEIYFNFHNIYRDVYRHCMY